MKKFILALAVCATIASCQKKEDTDPIDVSKTTYLMHHSWKLAFYTVNPDINDETSSPYDSLALMTTCQKDDIWKFGTTNRLTNYAMQKCVQTAPDSTVYGYELSSADKKFYVFTDPDLPDHATVYNADITYPTIDSFVITYTAPHPQDSSKTSRYVRAYVKQN
ncbi:MAG: hypothetical protein EOO01_18895 [Chitinophagaceae bacterium]|nr:MAG: hypothetical protein EOO01_18895 [Chitinophagaceae bacterium]